MITAMALILAEVLKLIGLFSDVMLAMIIFMTVALGSGYCNLKRKKKSYLVQLDKQFY